MHKKTIATCLAVGFLLAGMCLFVVAETPTASAFSATKYKGVSEIKIGAAAGSGTRTVAVSTTSGYSTNPPTDRTTWEPDAGGSVTLYYATATGGLSPPSAPTAVYVYLEYDSGTTIIRKLQDGTAPTATVGTFYATSDGTATGSPRCGIARIYFRAVGSGYDVNSDDGGSPPPLGSSTPYTGYLRCRMKVNSIDKNAYPAGSMYAYGTAGDETMAFASNTTLPFSDTNVETIRINTKYPASNHTLVENGATKEMTAVTGLANQSFVCDNTYWKTQTTYDAEVEILGNSALTGAKWTSMASTQGTGITRRSDTNSHYANRFVANSSLTIGSATPSKPIYNRGYETSATFKVLNARSEELTRAMTWNLIADGGTISSKSGSGSPYSFTYTLQSTDPATNDLVGKQYSITTTTAGAHQATGNVFKVSSNIRTGSSQKGTNGNINVNSPVVLKGDPLFFNTFLTDANGDEYAGWTCGWGVYSDSNVLESSGSLVSDATTGRIIGSYTIGDNAKSAFDLVGSPKYFKITPACGNTIFNSNNAHGVSSKVQIGKTIFGTDGGVNADFPKYNPGRTATLGFYATRPNGTAYENKQITAHVKSNVNGTEYIFTGTTNASGWLHFSYFINATDKSVCDLTGSGKTLWIVPSNSNTPFASSVSHYVSSLVRAGSTRKGTDNNYNVNHAVFNPGDETVVSDLYATDVMGNELNGWSFTIRVKSDVNGTEYTEAVVSDPITGRLAFSYLPGSMDKTTDDLVGSSKNLWLQPACGNTPFATNIGHYLSSKIRMGSTNMNIDNNYIPDITPANRFEKVNFYAYLFNAGGRPYANHAVPTEILDTSNNVEDSQVITTDANGRMEWNYTVSSSDTALHTTAGAQKYIRASPPDGNTEFSSGSNHAVSSLYYLTLNPQDLPGAGNNPAFTYLLGLDIFYYYAKVEGVRGQPIDTSGNAITTELHDAYEVLKDTREFDSDETGWGYGGTLTPFVSPGYLNLSGNVSYGGNWDEEYLDKMLFMESKYPVPDPLTMTVVPETVIGGVTTQVGILIKSTYFNGSGILNNINNLWLSIFNPSGTAVVTDAHPQTELGKGIYRYIYTVGAEPAAGGWYIIANASGTGIHSATGGFSVIYIEGGGGGSGAPPISVKVAPDIANPNENIFIMITECLTTDGTMRTGNANNTYITIIDAENVTKATNVHPFEIGQGAYGYIYDLGASPVTGNWKILVNMTGSVAPYSASDTFFVENGMTGGGGIYEEEIWAAINQTIAMITAHENNESGRWDDWNETFSSYWAGDNDTWVAWNDRFGTYWLQRNTTDDDLGVMLDTMNSTILSTIVDSETGIKTFVYARYNDTVDYLDGMNATLRELINTATPDIDMSYTNNLINASKDAVILEIQTQHATTRALTNSTAASLQADLTTIKGYTDTLETTVGDIHTDVATVDTVVDAIKLKTDTIVWSDITTIKGYTDTVEASLTTISGYTDSLETNLATVDGIVDAIKLKTDTILWTDITDIKGYTDTLETNLADVHTDLATVDGLIDAIKLKTDTIVWTDVTTIKADVATIKGYTDTLEATLSDVHDHVDTVETSLTTISGYTDTLETALANHDTNLNNKFTTWNSKFDGFNQSIRTHVSNEADGTEMLVYARYNGTIEYLEGMNATLIEAISTASPDMSYTNALINATSGATIAEVQSRSSYTNGLINSTWTTWNAKFDAYNLTINSRVQDEQNDTEAYILTKYNDRTAYLDGLNSTMRALVEANTNEIVDYLEGMNESILFKMDDSTNTITADCHAQNAETRLLLNISYANRTDYLDGKFLAMSLANGNATGNLTQLLNSRFDSFTVSYLDNESKSLQTVISRINETEYNITTKIGIEGGRIGNMITLAENNITLRLDALDLTGIGGWNASLARIANDTAHALNIMGDVVYFNNMSFRTQTRTIDTRFQAMSDDVQEIKQNTEKDNIGQAVANATLDQLLGIILSVALTGGILAADSRSKKKSQLR
ncbi:MAG: hypothetical protein PHH26_00505 [Candidatus Thermoplasmatota archaeon]|nr:hypothetical protein [Candidatus Thermoplasmatota archaeon]